MMRGFWDNRILRIPSLRGTLVTKQSIQFDWFTLRSQGTRKDLKDLKFILILCGLCGKTLWSLCETNNVWIAALPMVVRNDGWRERT